MQITGLVLFTLTYLLVSARRLGWLRLDRPAVVLAGAVACVALGVLTPDQARAAVDGNTLLLLVGVMGMGAYLAVDGFFDRLGASLAHHARTPGRLLAAIIWGSGVLAAFITNDAVCVLGAPLVVQLIVRHQLPPLPFLLGLATAANTGSVATLLGNPQNMLCAQLGGLEYLDHLRLVGPVAVLGLVANHLIVHWIFRKSLAEARLEVVAPQPALSRRTVLTLAAIVGSALAAALGAELAWAVLGGFVVLMVLNNRDTRQIWPQLDATLILFFMGLFVVVEGLLIEGWPARFFAAVPLAPDGDPTSLRLTTLFLVGSNVVSNVPFILVVEDQLAHLTRPTLGWELLTVASTFAGNLTLLGSVANIIVAESAHELGGLGFWQHLKVGFPVAVATTALGWAWLATFG